MRQRDRHRMRFTVGKHGPAVSVFCAAVLIALLMCLGLGQLVVKAYLVQDGFAVPADSLDRLLRGGGEPGSVALVGVDMGEAVYARTVGGGTYFVGEEKRAISAGYPLYTQSGQVLAFLDDASQMITSDWDTLTSYEGLYLSDGVTFNADRSQADIAEVLLVRVDGGYLLAQAAAVDTAGRTVEIPMNSACAFSKDGLLFYAYDKGVLLGTKLSVAPGAVITVGAHSYVRTRPRRRRARRTAYASCFKRPRPQAGQSSTCVTITRNSAGRTPNPLHPGGQRRPEKKGAFGTFVARQKYAPGRAFPRPKPNPPPDPETFNRCPRFRGS